MEVSRIGCVSQKSEDLPDWFSNLRADSDKFGNCGQHQLYMYPSAFETRRDLQKPTKGTAILLSAREGVDEVP